MSDRAWTILLSYKLEDRASAFTGLVHRLSYPIISLNVHEIE